MALREIQPAIDSAYEETRDGGPGKCEVWVAGGRYLVYVDSRDDTIQLRLGIELYGGFNGSESLRCERDFIKNETVLSACNDEQSCYPLSSDLGYVNHVIMGADESIIDGFIIDSGQSWFNPDAPASEEIGRMAGGGIYLRNNSMRVANTVFKYCWGYAVGMYESNLEISSCKFVNNGGGIYSSNSTVNSIRVEDSIFLSNSSSYGGAISGYSDLYIQNCVFACNRAGDNGGVISWDGNVEILNSTFAFNQVIYDSPIDTGDGHNIYGGKGNIHNSLFVPVAFGYGIEDGDYNINHSLYCGPNSDCKDPLFVNEGECTAYGIIEEPDFHLTSGSPCIDMADDAVAPERDIEGQKRYDVPGAGDSISDIGAYEYRP